VRILHIDLGRELRGGQHQVLLLLKMLVAAGHACTLLARAQSPLFLESAKLGIPTIAAGWLTLRRLSAQHDIVHAHDAHAHTWAAVTLTKPFVVARRVAFPIGRSPFSKWKYRRASRFLAVSNFVAEKLLAAGVPHSKIDIVFDAADAPEARLSWVPDAKVVALASFDPQKGRDLIERAAEVSRIPITFSNDLPKDLSHASAFVYVSRSEGFGSAALLAMTMGVPLVASHIDGMAEVFEDGISGLAVENHPDSIAAALTRLRANPELADSLIHNAHERARTLFNTTSLLTNTLASYQRTLAR